MPTSLKSKLNIIGKNLMITLPIDRSQIVRKKSPPMSNPETELLLCCARTHIGAKTRERIEALLQQTIDWNSLLAIAKSHGIVPLLHRNLNAAYSEMIPQSVLSQLQNLFQANAAHNLFFMKELSHLLPLFQENNISPILFKGPALAASAYGNVAFRQFCDLDLLFLQKDVLKAKDLLISQGYSNAEGLTREQEIAQLKSPYVKAYTYKKQKIGVAVLVELHWQLRATYSSFPLDSQDLWKRATRLSLADSTVFGLSPEDEILYLCAHGCGDRWERLLQVCDIAEAIRTHHNLNWQAMLQRATRLGGQRRLFLGLFLARSLLDADIPTEIWQKIQADSAIAWLSEWVYQRLFNPTDESISLFDQALFDLVCLERLQDKGDYLRDRSILLAAKKFRLGFAKKYGLPGGK